MFEVLKQYLANKVGVTTEQFEKLEPLLTARNLKKGEVILNAGDICKRTAFIEKGCLRSYVIDKKGKEHIISFAPENWWLADQNSLVKGQPAMFYIDAVEDSEVIFMEGHIQKVLEEVIPGSQQMFVQLTQNNIFAMQKRLVNHLSATADERYLDFIETYPSLALRLPQKMIAAYIGVAAESLSRIRGQILVKR